MASHPRRDRQREAGGKDHRAKRPRTVYADPDYAKAARRVMLVDLGQADPGSRIAPLFGDAFACCPPQVGAVKLLLVTATIALAGSAVASRWWKSDRDAKPPNASMTGKNGHEFEVGSIVHVSPFSESSGVKTGRSTSVFKRERLNGGGGSSGGGVSAWQRSVEGPGYDNRESSMPLRARRREEEDAVLDMAPEAVRAIPGGKSKHGHLGSGGKDSRLEERSRPAMTMDSPAQLPDGPDTFLESRGHRRRIDEDDGAVFQRKPAAPGPRTRKKWKHNHGASNRREFKIQTIMFERGQSPRRVPPHHHDDFRAAHGKPTRDFNASAYGTCSSREIVGLEKCPDLEGAVGEMLAAKSDMLRRIVEVLGDPASSGTGGNPDEPLLLVQKLALDEADAIFGAFEKKFVNVATDAAGWSPLPGGFNRWVERYYREVLHRTRPVIVTVHGDDVCALEQELSLDARMAKAGMTNSGLEESPQIGRRTLGEGEDFTVPVVLMTLGWDPSGDPTHREDELGRDRSCVFRVLEMKRVVCWFTSHTRYDSHTDSLFRYIPIGFGGYAIRNGLPQKAYIDASRRQLELLERCPANSSGRYDLLFQCNTLKRKPRGEIFKHMTEKESGPVPVNRAPLEPNDMVVATTKGIFAVSPPGTGADCFRHYEMLLGGNIVMVPDTYSLRQFLKGLPVFFFGHYDGRDWGGLTCESLLQMAKAIQTALGEERAGKGQGGLQFEKLTHGYWRRYIRTETLRAGGAEEGTPYVERSAVPLNEPGWETFRRVGCFSRRKYFHYLDVGRRWEVVLSREERTPEGCAARCSLEAGGGVGFFGISDGNTCWCDYSSPGVAEISKDECDIDCADGESQGGCGGRKGMSTTYVFGPEKGAPFGYLGCFPEHPHHMIHVRTWFRRTNTPYMCEAFCTSLRYPFFALENSQWCHCGVVPSNTPRSVQVPAYLPEKGYKPDLSPPNASHAAKSVPEGVRVGDPRFACHLGRCSGNPSLWGCGADGALDVYMNLEPCVLFRDCEDAD